MNITQNLWIFISLLIIFLILVTDPKSSSRGFGSNELSMLFSSVTEGQKFIRNLTWGLIVSFIILTLVINNQY